MKSQGEQRTSKWEMLSAKLQMELALSLAMHLWLPSKPSLVHLASKRPLKTLESVERFISRRSQDRAPFPLSSSESNSAVAHRGICSGTWDVICFLEHLCMSSVVKLLMVLGLTCIILFFLYLLLKVGIIQCIGRNLCKMSWAACQAYWSALKGIGSFLWHKLKNTKRVHRHRFRDIEEGCSSSDDDGFSQDLGSSRVMRRREFVRERRKDRMRRSLYPKRRGWKSRRYGSSSHHHVRWKASEASLHLGPSRRFHKPRQILPRSRKLVVRQRIR